MQTPDQSSEEIQQQPLYEFSTDNTLQSATKDSAEEHALQEGFPSPYTSSSQVQPEEKGAADEQLPSAEAIRQGLIYPPPPTFYQAAQVEPARPPLLPPAPMYTVPPGYAPSQQGYSPGPSPVGQPFVPIPPPVKKSRRWIWIVVSVLSIALLAACSLCGWGTYNFASTTFQQFTDSTNVVNNYYADIQAKNYSAAYSYLAPQGTISGLTLDQFIQQARSRDDHYGPVLTYTPDAPTAADPNSTTGPDLSHLTIIVEIGRKNLQYNALLTVQQLGNTWKITDFDSI